MNKCDIGLIGLGVMGKSLARNISNKGFNIAVYNRTSAKTNEFIKSIEGESSIYPTYSIDEFIESLKVPRKILIMVTSGNATDQTISQLQTKLSKGDLLMDGGNSFYKDTEKRIKEISNYNKNNKNGEINYLGLGISGGEEGALKGPCIMAGGSKEGYEIVSPILNKISINGEHGISCSYFGKGGSGHFIKMVHNGIEYALLQAISEVYDVLANGIKMDADKIGNVFNEWNNNELGAYLVEIAATVCNKIDDETNEPLLNMIIDKAEQKGTGRWTSQSALELGVPIPTIDTSISSRNISALKDERLIISSSLEAKKRIKKEDNNNNDELVKLLRDSLYCTTIISFTQGFELIRKASEEYEYNIDLSEVARIWKGGCIIRAKVLDKIQQYYEDKQEYNNLIINDSFSSSLIELEDNWRNGIYRVKKLRIACPALSSALDYYDSYRRERLPANIIQALRDLFGAHGYKRVDKSGIFHTKWE